MFGRGMDFDIFDDFMGYGGGSRYHFDGSIDRRSFADVSERALLAQEAVSTI